jgi:hypothetical protein
MGLTPQQLAETQVKYKAYKALYCSDLPIGDDTSVLTDEECDRVEGRIRLLRHAVKTFNDSGMAVDAAVVTHLIGDLQSRLLLNKRLQWAKLSQAEKNYQNMIRNHPEWRVKSNFMLDMTGSIVDESQSQDVAVFQTAVIGAIIASAMALKPAPTTPPEEPPPLMRPAPIEPSQITEQTVRDAMRGAPLKSQQGSVSLPTIRKYVQMLKDGKTPPAIRVHDGIIIEGNHRYVAGRIFGREPPIQEWVGGREERVVPWDRMKVDPEEW